MTDLSEKASAIYGLACQIADAREAYTRALTAINAFEAAWREWQMDGQKPDINFSAAKAHAYRQETEAQENLSNLQKKFADMARGKVK